MKKRVFAALFLLVFLFTALLPVTALAEGEDGEQASTALTITKPPYGETIYAGQGATFIARAENYTSITWRFISPDNSQSIDYDKLGNRFPSLSVSGGNTEVLVLSRIPLEMHNWKVACLFRNDTEEALTDTATIEVFEDKRTVTITSQPKGATACVTDEQDVVLTTEAMCAEGGDFVYQWFSSSTGSYTAMRAVPDATESSFTVPREVGTRYYCATVAVTTAAGTGEATYTDIVEVTFRPEEHVHVYSDVWTYNDISHWRQCTCGGHSEEAFHTYEWTVTAEPAAEADGQQRGVCTVCGFETVQPIPAGSQSTAPQTAARQSGSSLWLLAGLGLAAGAVIAAAVILIRRVLKSDDGE